MNNKCLVRVSIHPMDQSHVDLVLRGNTFRYGKQGCSEEARDTQLLMADHVIENIVRPLEEEGKTVDVYITSPPCDMNSALYEKYGSRLKGVLEKSTSHQGESISNGMSLSDPSHTLIMTRHDMDYVQPIREWGSFDDSKINLLSKCEERKLEHETWLSDCHNDALHIIPPSKRASFEERMGTQGCYMNSSFGHWCYPENHRDIHVISDWRPARGLGFDLDTSFPVGRLRRYEDEMVRR